MHLRRDSAMGRRFLASVRQGQGLKPSARAAGVGKETAYRWLREAFVELREAGVDVLEAQQQLGYSSPLVREWERARLAAGPDPRHHLALDVAVEEMFWAAFNAGASVADAARAASVSRATGFRWWRRCFERAREQGLTVRATAARLRIAPRRAERWEAERRSRVAEQQRAVLAADARAIRSAARQAAVLSVPVPSRTKVREARYWELMRSGLTNAAACRILGVSRRAGQRIRQRSRYQTVAQTRPERWSGRYLSLPERLKIADLLGFGWSLRKIAAELGRSPSTIKRELDRHRDDQGRYLPHTADHTARQRRRRPRAPKLAANDRLRRLVQRKLNRYWSPDEISGWLRRTHPDNVQLRISAETIYRALLLPGGGSLHERYCQRLRTGRRIRKSRWLTTTGAGGAVQNMTMIGQRPSAVDLRERVGDWEGDLIIGIHSGSAMVTLRERVTQYGLIVNLPIDHTATSVNQAVAAAFATLPRQVKHTLTWDQGVEMVRHQDLAKTIGMPIYFAERSSPWQRGANENYNRLVRQYYPKGTDLAIHSAIAVRAVQDDLNDRPRRGLDYATPGQAMRDAIRTSPRS